MRYTICTENHQLWQKLGVADSAGQNMLSGWKGAMQPKKDRSRYLGSLGRPRLRWDDGVLGNIRPSG